MHRVVYTKSVEECEEISCIALQSSKSSFRKIQILDEFADSALSLFYSLFRFKVVTASCCVYEKRYRIGRDKLCVVTVFEELVLQKYRFSNLHILHFRCFIPCFRVIARRKRTVVTLDMFISVQVYSFCFVSFRFAKYSKPFT